MIQLFTEISNIVQVSTLLLMSVCWQESKWKNVINYYDGGSRSIGVCQVKLATARDVLPNITEKKLLDPRINIFIAALYLKKHSIKYNSELKVISRYNGGYKNKITNWKYVNGVIYNKLYKPWENEYGK